jgi:hypothetical protein
VQYFLFSFLECAELHARESRHVPLVVKVSNLYVLKNYLKFKEFFHHFFRSNVSDPNGIFT